MNRFWDPNTIRFMIDASEKASYNRELAAMIGPQLSHGSHVCDAGCGLGYLSLELAKYARQVTAVDICPEALSVLHQNCVTRGIANIDIRCADIEQAPPVQKYDAMVFCLFGGSDQGLCIAKAQCRGDVFMVMRNYPAHRFSVNTHCMEYKGFRDTCLMLDVLGIPYEKKECQLDLGQPFRSMDDARLFFQRYSRDKDVEITDEFLKSRMEETNQSDFPYYMPHMRNVGIVHFQASDIPEDFAD